MQQHYQQDWGQIWIMEQGTQHLGDHREYDDDDDQMTLSWSDDDDDDGDIDDDEEEEDW